MHISKIKIRNYKNFYKCSIDLKKDITTIIGENGTGKTNLFYALRQLLDKNNRHFLDESDFSYELDIPKGHWIIISVSFENVPDHENTPESVGFNSDDTNNSIYTLIFRPNKIIRNTLYNMSQELLELEDDESKVSKKVQIDAYINDINIKNDYEVTKRVGNIFDFLNDSEYAKTVGDFIDYIFPNPDDVQDNTSIIGDNADNNLNDFINVTFIPAIRDVNSELVKNGNFFESMLNSISETIDETKWNGIKGNFNTINNELKEIEEYTNFADNILGMMQNTVGSSFSGNMFLDVSIPEDKANIIKYFSLKGKIEEHNIDLHNKSLGENNVIYFALKMLQNSYHTGHTKKLFNLLLIEEPESHLHKHLQQTFFSGIKRNDDFQILLSTHSVHVSESSNISSMVVLGKKCERSCEVYIPSFGLDSSDVKYLERYLDATRSPILFSKSVMLVEGTAELIFIDNILKMKYDFDLNAYGISIISVDSCFFYKISKLFHQNRLREKCSILTDLDGDFDGNGQNAAQLSTTRVNNLKSFHNENPYVEIFTNNYTFEIELYTNNLDSFSQYVSERQIYTRDTERILNELSQTADNSTKFRRIIMIAESLGKGWLALDFIEWLKSKDKSLIENFKLPDYITDALKNFFPSDIYNKEVYNQIVSRYCIKNQIDINTINDEFILYIKGLYNEE